MEDKKAEELEFHRETVMGDSNSPLHLIREKEIEISGRILAAKRQADEVISTARREAVALVADAKGDASHVAQEHDLAARMQTEKQQAEVRAKAEEEIAQMESAIADKKRAAVEFVIDSVLGAR